MATPRTVLVVDDHTAHRQLLALVLGAHHLEVAHADDGFAALAYLQARTPDAIILDVHMPRMSGLEVGARIRGVQRLRNVPILVMTSAPTDEVRRAAEAFGAADVLAKPVSGTELRQRLSRLLGAAPPRTTVRAA